MIDSTTTFYLDSDELRMNNYKLTKLSKKDFVNSGSIIRGGKIYSKSEINITGRFASNLDGDFILTGKDTMLFVGDNVIDGIMRVAKEKVIQEECCAGRLVYINADIYNYGTIKNRFGGLNLYFYGNVFNYGKIEVNWLIGSSNNNTLKIFGEINSNISLERVNGATSANFLVDQFLKTKFRLLINSNTTLTISNNSEINVDRTIENNGTVLNNGKIINRYRINSSNFVSTHNFMYANATVYDRGTSDSLIIKINSVVHPKLSSSIKRYWTITGNKKINSYSVTLNYDDEILNGQDPNSLDAYVSTDGGNTWKKVSNPLNVKRDLVNKKITIGTSNLPITYTGDLNLSSGNVTNLPSISIAISGRKEVRVGPPNRYTITYWNNSNYSTDKFFIKLNTNQGVYFEGIQTKKIGKDSTVVIPIDSLVYDNKKDEVILLIQPLKAKEVRSFDVIVKSALGPTFKTLEPITFTAVAL